MSGTLRFTVPGGGADASSGPYNYLQNLRFALMLQGEARKGEWSVFADAIYLNFGRHESSVNSTNGVLGTRETQQDVQTSFAGTLIQLGGSRTLLWQEWGYIDAVAGMRYLGVKGTLDAAVGATVGSRPGASSDFHVAQTQNIFNGFAGMRGRATITRDGAWYIPVLSRRGNRHFEIYMAGADRTVLRDKAGRFQPALSIPRVLRFGRSARTNAALQRPKRERDLQVLIALRRLLESQDAGDG
ncbi:hypothetical protein [Caballeronia terrestris]|uniref:hypothetical protein n=1 Tax=Caballeronia terrestris TaxID=1226301 RepID=UPI000F737940|nr:hypothetical protein [Caballeronia terrestris]